MADVPQLATLDQFGNPRTGRIETQFVVDHVQPVGLAGRAEHVARFDRIQGGRFFT